MKCLRVVLLICALPLQAQVDTLDTLKFQPQERSQWCWAAVSAMAISAFPEGGGFRHLNQLEVVARRKASAPTIAAAGPASELISSFERTCAAVTKCDSGAEPLLFDIASDRPPSGSALAMAAFRQDITVNKRPVIIRWRYSSATAANTGFGTHAIIVTGYNVEANKLRIYDPLPLGSNSNKHEMWIPFDTYLKPSVHEGKKVVPRHEFDQFKMRRTQDPVPPGSYPMISARADAVPTRHPGGFEPVEALKGPIDQYIKQEQQRSGFLRSNGTRRTGNITGGIPIAVVTLDADQLVGGNASPESRLVRRASAYIVPVLEGNDIVDTFQLLPENGGWRQGGYSSLGIAHLLTTLTERDQIKRELRAGEVFYLVSIPELAAYYLAHGFQAEARLKSLDYEGRGDFEPARVVFDTLNRRVRDMEADRNSTTPTVTPR
jgi:hypothetical protein